MEINLTLKSGEQLNVEVSLGAIGVIEIYTVNELPVFYRDGRKANPKFDHPTQHFYCSAACSYAKKEIIKNDTLYLYPEHDFGEKFASCKLELSYNSIQKIYDAINILIARSEELEHKLNH